MFEDNNTAQSSLATQRDRITQLLSNQSQPSKLGQGLDLAGAFLSSLSKNTGAAGVHEYMQNIEQARQQSQAADLQKQMGLYNLMQDQAKQGNEDAVAVDKAIKDIAGNDISAYSKIASALQEHPEPVNKTNATLLASRAAAKMGYKPMSQTADELELQYKKAQIAKALKPEAAANGGATGVIIGNIMRDNPGMNFTQALQLYQTGFRQGTRINPESGEVETMPGYLGIREQTKAAEAKGTEIGKKQGELGTKAITAPQVLDLVDQAKTLLPQASSGKIQSLKTGAMNLAGVSTPRGEADAQLDMISAGLTLNVPRMEGPQSDRDTMLYKQAAGQVGNASLPYKTRLAALSQVERLNKKYLSQNEANVAPKKRYKYNPATGKVE